MEYEVHQLLSELEYQGRLRVAIKQHGQEREQEQKQQVQAEMAATMVAVTACKEVASQRLLVQETAKLDYWTI